MRVDLEAFYANWWCLFFADDDLVPIKRRRLEATAADRQLLLSDGSFFTTRLPDLQKHEGSWQKYATSN